MRARQIIPSLMVVVAMLQAASAHAGHSHGDEQGSSSGGFTSRQIGIAFAISIAAGLATCIGGAVPFLDLCTGRCVRPGFFRGPVFFGSSLGFASGLMLYSALASLVPEARELFESAPDVGEKFAELATAGSFFLGVVLTAAGGLVLQRLLPHGHHMPSASSSEATASSSEEGANTPHKDDVEMQSKLAAGSTEDINNERHSDSSSQDSIITIQEAQQLYQFGILTAIAIALHNIPEGLATFTASLNNPSFGGVLAVGIAVHNIPEGICVALPIFYATKSRLKAFLYTLVVAGLSEPLGSLIGYAAFAANPTASTSGSTFGVMYCFVAGMLTFLVICGVLPNALERCKNKVHVFVWFFIGVFVMELGLIIFVYA